MDRFDILGFVIVDLVAIWWAYSALLEVRRLDRNVRDLRIQLLNATEPGWRDGEN